MKKKNVYVCVLLSIITLGLYSIFWTVDLMFQTDKCFQKKGFSVLWKIVLTIFTGGLYAIYWVYQIGKEMANKSKYIIDKSLIYLVLMIAAVLSEYTFALHLLNNSYLYISISIFYEIIVLSLIQNDLNLLIDKKIIK